VTIRVLIADDHPIVRSGIRNELSNHQDIEIVGEAVDGNQTLQKTHELRPAVLVLDIQMPGMKAVQVLRAIQEMPEGPNVLILTAFKDPEDVLGMLRAGAKGYLLKDSDSSEIVEAIRTVSAGKTWLSPLIEATLIDLISGAKVLGEKYTLSGRENDVLRLLARGYSNDQIAGLLGISEGTVKNHVTNIYDKIGVHTRSEAVAWAWEHGVVKVGPPRSE
jgi:DNA-binding NarL/FixJ family response regulator